MAKYLAYTLKVFKYYLLLFIKWKSKQYRFNFTSFFKAFVRLEGQGILPGDLCNTSKFFCTELHYLYLNKAHVSERH